MIAKLKILVPFLFVIAVSWFAVREIIKPGYFAMHDDMQVIRQMQMDKCFHDKQIPCRWVPDLGYGFGYPLFNYYPPMPYYLGQIFVWLGFNFFDTIKVISVLGFLTATLGTYLLAREFWGRLGGLVSAVFYTYAPYHAVDLYVRGAVNEFWALAWFPFIFWSVYKLIQTRKWTFSLILTFTTAMLLLSHNQMLMIFAPGVVAWTLYWLVWEYRNSKQPSWYATINLLFVTCFWAFSLAAFYTLPVLFEKKYAHLESLIIGYFNYLAHFVSLRQMFVWKDWGYGASELGLSDGMSFQIGHLHWIASLLSLIVAWQARKIKSQISYLILIILAFTYGSAFMMHARSTPIWQFLTPLEFLQFPWRFLSIVIFGVSFLSGSLLIVFKDKAKTNIFLVACLVFLVIVYNQSYFRWREYYPDLTEEQKFSGKLWQLQITSGIFDYLPISAPLPPVDPAPSGAQIIEGEGEITTVEKKSNFQSYNFNLTKQSVIRLNTFYFPGWRYFLIDNGSEELKDYDLEPELGVPEFNLPEGKYKFEARFTNTPVRAMGNYLSLIGWVGLIGFFFYRLFKVQDEIF